MKTANLGETNSRPFPIVAEAFTEANIREYLRRFTFGPSFPPAGVTIHHTAAPSLAQRPLGLTRQHLENIRGFYARKGWKSGPHFFVDQRQVWAFTPLNLRGVHAVSFNRSRIGIEMLGDFDREDPWRGEGLKVLRNTRALLIACRDVFGWPVASFNFHRDDPRTAKTCPGRKISREAFVAFVEGVR